MVRVNDKNVHWKMVQVRKKNKFYMQLILNVCICLCACGYILEPETKKVASSVLNNTSTQSSVPPVPQIPPRAAPPTQNSMPPPGPPSLSVPAALSGGSGPQFNEDIKVPDKMVGLSKFSFDKFFKL